MRSSARKFLSATAVACTISFGAVTTIQAPASANSAGDTQLSRASAVAARVQPDVPPVGQPFYMCLPDIVDCLAPAIHGAIFTVVHSDNPQDWAKVTETNPYYYGGHDWYELSAGGECLNWDPIPNVFGWQPVYADSCVPGDFNELWYPDSAGQEWVNLHGNVGYGVDTFLQLCCVSDTIGGQVFTDIGANTGTGPSSEFDGWAEPHA